MKIETLNSEVPNWSSSIRNVNLNSKGKKKKEKEGKEDIWTNLARKIEYLQIKKSNGGKRWT